MASYPVGEGLSWLHEFMGDRFFTSEEAQKAYEEAKPEPVSEERIAAIVRYATGQEGPST